MITLTRASSSTMIMALLCIASTVYAGTLTATPMTITWEKLDNTTVRINVSCQCTGWSGVGWSKPGPAHAGMDVIQGTVSSTGTATLTDAFSSSYSQPTADSKQDYTVVFSSATASSTFYSFNRTINTTDANDVVLADGLYLYYAYTSTSTAFSTKHDSKGSAAVDFLTPCNAPSTLINPDGATYQSCIQVDSTYGTKIRWNVVGSSIQAQIEGKNIGAAFAYTLGIRPKKYTGFPANSHPGMGTAGDDFVDTWTAGAGGTCGTGSYCIRDGSLKGFNTGGDNSQFSSPGSAGTNASIFKYQFTRAFDTRDSSDQVIDTTTDFWLMYSYRTSSGPQSSPSQHQTPVGYQYVINFGQNYTCNSDWKPGVCNTTVVTPGGGSSGGGNSSSGGGGGSSSGNSYTSSTGLSLSWTPSSTSIRFDYTFPTGKWGGVGLNAAGTGVHLGTEFMMIYQTSAGWKIQSSYSNAKQTPTANPDPTTPYVLSVTTSGSNNIATFTRPLTGGPGTSYTIPDASTVVSIASGATAATVASIADCNYHLSTKDFFTANLISGGATSGGGGGSTGSSTGSNTGVTNKGGDLSFSAGSATLTWTAPVGDTITFEYSFPGGGWGGVGFNAKTSGVHIGTEFMMIYQTSAGWAIQSSYSTSKTNPTANPAPTTPYSLTVIADPTNNNNKKAIFTRPLKGGPGTSYTIPNGDTVLSIAYGPQSSANAASISDLSYHTARDLTVKNLITGASGKIDQEFDGGTLFTIVVLGFFGIYSLIRWTYKAFKFTTRRRTPLKNVGSMSDVRQAAPPGNDVQHRQFYRGSVAVPYKIKPAANAVGLEFNPDGTPVDAAAPEKKMETKIEGFETAGGSTTVTVTETAPQKKIHARPVNAVHGLWRARIPKTHIAVSDAILGAIYVFLNVYFTHIHKYIKYQPYETWGYMCTANSLLVALPATRNSVLVWVLGVPFDVAIMYHRWIGRVAIAQGVGHFILSVSFLSTKMIKYYYGLGAVIAMMLLFLTSIAPLRRKTFNFFFASHHVFIAFYVLGSFHSPTYFFKFALAATAVYGFDRLLRIIWGAYPVKAQVKLLPGSVAKIVFPKHCLAHYEIGQYIFLNFPQIDLFEWHPFTLASGPGEKTNEVDIKALGNFTRKVLALSEVKGGTLWLRQDGPYGHWPYNYARYPNVVAISGGVGVTPCIALLRHVYHINRPNATVDSIVQNIFFVWSCKSVEEFGWFREELEEIYKKEGKGYPKLHAYIHITSNKGDKPLENGLRSGRPNLPAVFGDIVGEMNQDKSNSRAFVVTCGPAQMVNESWDLATKYSAGGIRFDYHHETFEF